MRMMALLAAMLAGLGAWSAPASAAVDIQVDLSTQTMHVRSGSGESYDWPVSTARMGYVTPNGHFGVQSLQAMHYSHKYNDSPMPHSIFFHGGYAIHGTYETASLGAAASHGCVRLSPAHAARLYDMVRAEGGSINIVGSPTERGETRMARRRAAEPEDQAWNEEEVPAPSRRALAYAHAQRYGVPVVAGRLPLRGAPAYGGWVEDPFAAVDEY